MAHLAFVFVCAAWGTSFILLERLSHTFGPVTIGIWRLLTSAVVLGAIWWFRRREYHWERRYWGPILVSALLANVPAYVVQPWVISQGFGHSFFGIMVAGMPLITILLSIPMLDIRPSARQLIGVCGGLLCLWLVVDDGFGRGMSLGILALSFVVPLTGAFNNTFIKWKLPGAAAIPVTTVMLGSAGLMLVPLAFCQPALNTLQLGPPTQPVGGLTPYVIVVLFGIFGTGLSTAAFFYMVFKKGPLYAGMTTYVVPLLALLWGELDHEMISSRQLVAMGGVLLMVALVQSGSSGDNATVTHPESLLDESLSELSPATIPVAAAIGSGSVAEPTVNAA